MDDIQGKHVELSIDKPDQLYRFAHALASPVRIRIMQALGSRSMNVGELAETLDIPMSTTALAVKTLEEAGIITTETQPGARGAMKLCSRRLDSLSVQLEPEQDESNVLAQTIPLGGYSQAEGIMPTCGLASREMIIGEMDVPGMFYSPERFHAQLLWFRQGALEYRFAFPHMDMMEIDWLEMSFEACSEAPMHRDPWKSDIAVSINGRQLGVWTCPCDCGGRQGKLTPGWWPALSTQFGLRLSGVTIGDLRLGEEPCIRVRIEVPPDAQNVGGINLFGEFFGDYPQAIVVRAGYRLKPSVPQTAKNLE